MSSFTFTGILKVKFPEQVVSDKFKKREFVVTDNASQYPQHVVFQLTQDRCGLVDPFQPGQEVKVSFNLRGREWNSPQGEIKYFNTVEAWRVEAGGAVSAPQAGGFASAPSSAPDSSSSQRAPETFIPASSQEDDLPF